MKKSCIIIIILLVISLITNGIMFYKIKNTKPIYIHDVDTIEKVIDNIKYKIDTLLIKVKDDKKYLNELENKYKQDYNSISNQSTDSNYIFFKRYIESQRERGLFDNNN